MGEKRTNLFQSFVDVMSEMNRMREVGRTGYETGYEDRRRTDASAWVPTADIFARGEDLVIRLELAGIAPEDIDVSFYDGVLTVSGEHPSELDEDVSFYVHECFYGFFRRSMILPASIDEGRIGAEFDNGMLEITVRDAAATEPRHIEIREKNR
jgi:HSP20 family protein